MCRMQPPAQQRISNTTIQRETNFLIPMLLQVQQVLQRVSDKVKLHPALTEGWLFVSIMAAITNFFLHLKLVLTWNTTLKRCPSWLIILPNNSLPMVILPLSSVRESNLFLQINDLIFFCEPTEQLLLSFCCALTCTIRT